MRSGASLRLSCVSAAFSQGARIDRLQHDLQSLSALTDALAAEVKPPSSPNDSADGTDSALNESALQAWREHSDMVEANERLVERDRPIFDNSNGPESNSLTYADGVMTAHSRLRAKTMRFCRGRSHTNLPRGCSDDDASCAICLGDYTQGEELSLLPCKHVFHAACFRRWGLQGGETCPCCRGTEVFEVATSTRVKPSVRTKLLKLTSRGAPSASFFRPSATQATSS